MEISIVIPALNEERTVGLCIVKAQKSLRRLNIIGEVIVADNSSTDKTVLIAEQLGARVVSVPDKGYGNAYLAGFDSARGKYLIMGDADDSYNFEEIDQFYQKLREGYEFVMGNRFRGTIEAGAMPWLHRYVGTPFLTGVMNLFFKTRFGDTNCGMRAMTKEGFEKMGLNSPGMEFATEMVIKASLAGLKLTEVPCNLYRDKRDRKPHLRTFRDGWRYLRFMLLFSPSWTFIIPGTTTAIIGLVGLAGLLIRDIYSPNSLILISQRHMLSSMLLVLVGTQIITFGMVAHVFGITKKFSQRRKLPQLLNKFFHLEKSLLVGLLAVLSSVLVLGYLFISFYWKALPDISELLRFDIAIITITFLIIGIQIIFASFLLGIHYHKIN